MKYKGGKNYAVLSLYITPTTILMNRKNEAERVKKNMIKNVN